MMDKVGGPLPVNVRDPLSRYHEFLLPPRVDEWIPPGHIIWSGLAMNRWNYWIGRP